MSTPGATTEERKDGVVGWTKKLVLCLPLLYILVNALVQAREITDKIATEVYSGFDASGVSSKVILGRKEDLTNSEGTLTDENGYSMRLGAYNNIEWYIYDTTGAVSNSYQDDHACNSDFVNKYNSNLIPKINVEECRLGKPKVTSTVCANYEHPAYIAISVLWAGYVAVYLSVLVGYNFFSYSAKDIRWYIAAVKFKHSIRNRVLLVIGVVLTWLTSAVAFFYLGGGGQDDTENWGEGIQFDDVVEALTKIFIFFVINTKAMADLNKSENYNFDHISLSRDFPEPIWIEPCPESEKRLHNLWGAIQTVDEVLFLFEEAYLHSMMFNDDTKSINLSLKRSKVAADSEVQESGLNDAEMVKKVVNLFHADDLEDIKTRINSELEAMAKDPVTKKFVVDAGKMSDSEKFDLVREQTTGNVAPGLEILRKLMVMSAPVGLIFTNALNMLMKIGQNAENIQYGGFDVGDMPPVSNPDPEFYRSYGYETYMAPVLPGELSSNMTQYNYYTDCVDWYNVLTLRQTAGVNMNGCDASYPAKVLTVNLVCPFTTSAMFVSMLTIWVVYSCVLATLLFIALKDYSSNDLRFYLISDSIKTTPLWKAVLRSGRVLVATTFVLALVYECARPYVQWTDIVNIFIFLFLMMRVFEEVDSPPFVKFCEEVRSKPLDEVHPDPIPIVVQNYTNYKESILPKIRPTSSIFAQMVSLYLKALVLEEPLMVTHLCDWEKVTSVMHGLRSDVTVESKSTNGGPKKEGELELIPTPPPTTGSTSDGADTSVAVPPGPGTDNRMILATEDPDTV